MSSKFAIENENVLQLLGDFATRPLTAPPLDPGSPPRSLVQFKNFLKKALISRVDKKTIWFKRIE